MARYNPRRSEIYTIEQIYHELKLRDSPHLGCSITNPLGELVKVVVQDAMALEADLIKAFAGKSFRYLYETSEWIPVFEFVGTEQEFLECVEVNVDLDPYLKPGQAVRMLVWPKGTIYEQYHKLSDDKSSLLDMYGSHPVPPQLKEALDKQA